MVVLLNGIDERRASERVRRVVRGSAYSAVVSGFLLRPAKINWAKGFTGIGARLKEADLLIAALSDVSHVKIAVLPVEADAIGIAHAGDPDFGASADRRGWMGSVVNIDGVTRGNPEIVGAVGGINVGCTGRNVQAKDLAAGAGGVL